MRTHEAETPLLLLDDEAAGSGTGSWAVLRDHVVVFTTSLGADGAPAATLVPCPGARAYLPVCWRTQPATTATFFADAVLEDGDAGLVRGAWLDAAEGAVLEADGRPVRVADVPTTGCALPALSRQAMLRWMHRVLAPGCEAATFRDRLARDQSLRRAAVGRLAQGLHRRPRRRSDRRIAAA